MKWPLDETLPEVHISCAFLPQGTPPSALLDRRTDGAMSSRSAQSEPIIITRRAVRPRYSNVNDCAARCLAGAPFVDACPVERCGSRPSRAPSRRKHWLHLAPPPPTFVRAAPLPRTCARRVFKTRLRSPFVCVCYIPHHMQCALRVGVAFILVTHCAHCCRDSAR